jgi:hypothetical protein
VARVPRADLREDKEFVMTIDMTPWRRAAVCLVAGVGVVLALAWAAGDARATSLDRELRSVVKHGAPGAKVVSPTRVEWPRQGATLFLKPTKAEGNECKLYWVCLHEDANFQGRMVRFNYRGTYKLARFGMPPTRAKGASSWENYRWPATLIGPNFTHTIGYGYDNIPRSFNDRATYIRLKK